MSTSAISSVASTPQTQPPSTTAVGYSRTSSLDLTLTTRDGDTVTISAQQTTTAGVSRTKGADGDATAAAKATASSLSVTVDGSLDAHELADIKKVLKTLADGARTEGLHGHHHGHRDHGSRGDQKQGGLSTIASVSGSFSSSVAVLGGVLYGAPATGDQPAAPADDTPATVDAPATTDVPAAA